MTKFVVPESKAVEERFEFELAGKEYSLPKIDYIPLEAGMLFQDEQPIKGIVAVAGDDEDLRKALLRLSADQVQALVEAWSAAGETDLGE